MSTRNWIKFIALGVVWGSSFLWIKIAVGELSTFTLVTLRLFFATGGLLAVVLLSRHRLPLRRWKTFLVMGAFNIALPFMLITWAEKSITSALASILNSTVPLFTILFAGLFLRDDPITQARVAGLLVGFGGVVVLVMGPGNRVGGLPLGILAMLLAAASYAGATVFARRHTQGMTADVQGLGQQIMATAVMIPLTLGFETPLRLPHLPITWLALAWLGLLGTCVGAMLYYSLLHSVGPTRTMLSSYLFPLVGVILGIIFLHEKASWTLWLGVALIFSGIWLVNSNFHFLPVGTANKPTETHES